MIALARFISFVFNPILVLLFVPFVLLYRSTHNLYDATMWTLYTAFFLISITAFILYCVQRKLFTDMDVSKKEQRPLLFLVSVIFALLYLSGLFFMHGPYILFVIAFGIIFGIFVVSIINRYIKASVHVATVSALIFAVAMTYDGFYRFLLLLIPLVAWARVKIKRHTLSETIVGGTLGITLALCIYFLNGYLSH
jgi:hypothetical protein